MQLQETAALMESADYKDRFKAEYWQLKIRYDKLANMVAEWDAGKLSFTPACARGIYDAQLAAMKEYLHILEMRATIENVEL